MGYENLNEERLEFSDAVTYNLEDGKIVKTKLENQKSNIKDPVIQTFNFNSNSQSDIIDGKIFVNLLLFFTRTKNPFNQEVRQMPVSFGYKSQEKYNINIEIPQGYMVESMPAKIKVAAENNDLVYTLNFFNDGNKIQISCTNEINSSIFAAEQYKGLKDIFQKIIASQNQKIVLKKI